MTGPIIHPQGTIATDPIRNFRFLVEFLPHDATGFATNTTSTKRSMGFTNVSGFGVSIDPIAYREGGYNTTMHYMPGQAAFTPISFTRGQTIGARSNHNWMRSLFAVIGATNYTNQTTVGKPGADFRCNIDVSVLSHPNPAQYTGSNGTQATTPYSLHTSMRFRIYNAWISSLVYGDLSAGGSGIMVEGMTVVHEGFDVTYADNFRTSATKFTY